MAAITDLTWQQVQDALGVTGGITVTSSKVVINVETILGSTTDALSDAGVLKFLNKLLDACLDAQATANTNQATGEKLNSFGTPTYGAITNGNVLVTRTVRLNAQLESATTISGPNV